MGVFQIDPKTGTPRLIARLDGYLTRASGLAPPRITMSYVRSHLEAFGLDRADMKTFVFQGDYVDVGGTHHLAWTQEVSGVRAFDNGLLAAVTKEGRLVNVSGSPAHALAPRGVAWNPQLSGREAVMTARSDAGGGAFARRHDMADLVLFHGGRTRLAWQTTTRVSPSETYVSVVDATTGEVLWRSNITRSAERIGTGLAWEYYPSTRVPNGGGTQQPVTFRVRNGNRLAGNDAHVFADTRDDDIPDAGDEIPSLSGLDWSVPAELDTTTSVQNCKPAHACTWNRTVPRSWRANMRQSAVQTYHYVQTFHDHLSERPIGFNEAAGNFQRANPSGRGRGHDAMRVHVFDGAATHHGLPDERHLNNANTTVPPDGRAPTMQLYLFHKAPYAPRWVSGNAGDDASIVYHEYTHGLSSRLVTYANGLQALNTWQSGAMGEGWSDWYALDYLEQLGYELDAAAVGDVLVGRYITGGQGIRTQPLDCTVGSGRGPCPGGDRTGPGGFTYEDFGRIRGFVDVHADGEIWAQTLWQLRRALIADLGRNAGIRTARRIVTRAMELSPPDPSFLDMRNAMLQADVVADDGAHAELLWRVFAKRGMGYFATSLGGDDLDPHANSARPPSCGADPCGRIHGRITDGITGRPVRGVVVGIGGDQSGFPGTDLVATTDKEGRFEIRKVPFHRYRDVVVDRTGFEPVVVRGIRVDGDVVVRRQIFRDWAALDAGARVIKFTPPDYSSFGCGPAYAFDRSLVSGWSSDAPNSLVGSSVTGPRSVTVKLPRAVDVTAFAIDPAATCGDRPTSAVKAFDVFTRPLHGAWTLAYRRTGGLSSGVLHRLVPRDGDRNVRFVRLTMKSNHGEPYFMDVTEFSVRGRRG
jgi:hypothetical protein